VSFLENEDELKCSLGFLGSSRDYPSFPLDVVSLKRLSKTSISSEESKHNQ